MPTIDGLKLANMIKSIENVWHKELTKPEDIRLLKAQQSVPIIAITASDIESIEESARKVGIK